METFFFDIYTKQTKIMVLLDSTAVATQASQFGVFEKLTDYGALGLIVLATDSTISGSF